MLKWLRSRLMPSPAGDPSARSSPLSTAVAAKPDPSDAWALYRAGHVDEAERVADAALQGDPSNVDGLVVRGLLALDRKRTMDALRVLQQATKVAPNHVEALVAFGRASLAAGRKPAAIASFEHALRVQPASGAASMHLGLIALQSGDQDRALRLLTAAVQGDPALAEAHFHLGNLLRERGRPDDAERHYRRAVSARADFAEALCNLGSLLNDRGNHAEGVPYLEQALKAKPELANASYNLAMVSINERRWEDGAVLLRQSLAADPANADAQYWLGNALMGAGDVAAARAAYQAAIRLDRNHVRARWCHAIAQLPAVPRTSAEQLAAAEAYGREVRKLAGWFRTQRPGDGFKAVGSQQPFYLAYIAHNHRSVLAEYGAMCSKLMAEWASKVRVPPVSKAAGPKRRVGIVSSHIHSHSVWHALVSGWVAHVDPAHIELQLFHTGSISDSETASAARAVKKLHVGLGDWGRWAKTISDSELDVLIYPDLGMDDATSIRLAALRLARIQLASWGHPITTGLPTMDGFVSAEALEPEDAASHYSETLIRLPRLGCCYRPYGTVARLPDLSAWGIGQDERLLICAGTPFKYSPADDSVLIEIARRCKPCKLIFFRASPASLSTLLEQRLRAGFDAAGMRFDDYVRFIPWQSQADFFGLLRRADVYLDTLGFSGFNTAMQALECGTPIVAWEGGLMRGRFASGILRQAGLDEWVASTHAGYVERVERLCADGELRATLRGQIAERMPRLCNDKAAATALWEVLDGFSPVSGTS